MKDHDKAFLIAGVVAGAVAGLAAAVILRLTGKRLRRRLEEEFGKRRH